MKYGASTEIDKEMIDVLNYDLVEISKRKLFDSLSNEMYINLKDIISERDIPHRRTKELSLEVIVYPTDFVKGFLNELSLDLNLRTLNPNLKKYLEIINQDVK